MFGLNIGGLGFTLAAIGKGVSIALAYFTNDANSEQLFSNDAQSDSYNFGD